MASSESARIRTTVRMLGAAGFVVMAVTRMMDLLLPAVAQAFDTPVADAAIIVTAYALAYGLFQLVYGPLGDRIGKLKVVAATLALASIGTAACALAQNVATLALLRFAAGTTAAAIVPMSLALLGDEIPYEKRQATIGRYLGALMMGQILGGSLAGVIAQQFGWRAVFVAFGLAGIAVAVPLRRAARRSTPPPAATRRLLDLAPYARLLRQRPARLLMAAVLTEGFFFYGGFAFLGATLRDHFSLSYLAIGAILTGFGVGGLVYSRTVAVLVRRLGERRMILTGGFIVAASYVAFGFAPHWPAALASLVGIGFGFYMLHNTFQTLATEIAPGTRGVALSMFAFMVFLGQGIGVATLGRIVTAAGYGVLLAVCGVGIALLALWFERRVADVKEPSPA